MGSTGLRRDRLAFYWVGLDFPGVLLDFENHFENMWQKNKREPTSDLVRSRSKWAKGFTGFCCVIEFYWFLSDFIYNNVLLDFRQN